MAQEHKDQIMIQKSLSGAVEPEEQAEVDRIGQQWNAKNKGEAIQMPPLHEALVEVHREYEKASRAARDMAERYKKATTAADVLNTKYNNKQEENKRLKEQLQRDLVAMEKAMDQIVELEAQRQTASDQELNGNSNKPNKENKKRKVKLRKRKPETRNWKLNYRWRKHKLTNVWKKKIY